MIENRNYHLHIDENYYEEMIYLINKKRQSYKPKCTVIYCGLEQKS